MCNFQLSFTQISPNVNNLPTLPFALSMRVCVYIHIYITDIHIQLPHLYNFLNYLTLADISTAQLSKAKITINAFQNLLYGSYLSWPIFLLMFFKATQDCRSILLCFFRILSWNSLSFLLYINDLDIPEENRLFILQNICQVLFV